MVQTSLLYTKKKRKRKKICNFAKLYHLFAMQITSNQILRQPYQLERVGTHISYTHTKPAVWFLQK